MDDNDIEWLTVTPDEVLDTVRVDMPGARGLVVGPNEILVVVLPGFVNMQQLDMHRRRLKESLGDRFALVAGDGVQLAKVKTEDWGVTAIPQAAPALHWLDQLGDQHG